MPNFRYRAITQTGELVNGSLSAPTAAEVARRIEYLGLVPVETVVDDGVAAVSSATIAIFNQPRATDVTLFSRDLALLFKNLATLRTDAPLLRDVDELRWHGPTNAFAAWAERLGEARLLERSLAAPFS